jgi:hypothetical protein
MGLGSGGRRTTEPDFAKQSSDIATKPDIAVNNAFVIL